MNKPPGSSAWVLLASIIMSMIGAVGTYLASTSEARKADADIVNSTFERTKYLEQELFKARANELELQMRLSDSDQTEFVLKNLADKMPYPAFFKQISQPFDSNPVITNWYINEQYEDFFGYAQERYEGRTDIEVWGVVVGTQFYNNDLYALKVRTAFCTEEVFPTTPGGNVFIGGFVCKMIFRTNQGLMLFGNILLEDHIQNAVIPKEEIDAFIDRHL